jgi:hypothetical protein
MRCLPSMSPLQPRSTRPRAAAPAAGLRLGPDPSPPADVAAALDEAAQLAARADLSLEQFMRAAWSAYVDGHPGMRQRLETEQLLGQLAELRQRGAVGQA